MSCISFGHFCVWLVMYLEYFLILCHPASLLTSFRSSQSSCLSPSRHTPFHVTDLSLGSLLSFLERLLPAVSQDSCSSLVVFAAAPDPSAFSQKQRRNRITTFFFHFYFNLNYLVDCESLKIIIQEKIVIEGPQKKTLRT